jgi:hypothetical protein
MIRLPKFSDTEPKSLLSPLQRRLWRCHKLAWTHCGNHLPLAATPPIPSPVLSKYREKIREVTGGGAVSLFQISLYSQVFPFCAKLRKRIRVAAGLRKSPQAPSTGIEYKRRGRAPWADYENK